LDLPEIEKITSFIPELEEIDLGFCHNVDAPMLKVLSQRCQKLKAVNLEGCRSPDGVTNDALRALCENLACSLSRLNVSHCSALTDEFLLSFARNAIAIEALNADGIPWISDLSLSILSALHSSTLTELRLDGEELTDLSISGVGDSCLQLRALDISFCDLLTDTSLKALRNLRRLRQLRLKRGTGFSAKGLRDLFRPLEDDERRGGGGEKNGSSVGRTSRLSNSNGTSVSPRTVDDDVDDNNLAGISPFPEMETLMLPECSHLDNEGLSMIVGACGKTMTKLNLSWCWEIDDSGLQLLVGGCPRLQEMELQGMKVLEGSPFVTLLTSMPDITYVGLQQCNHVDDDILNQLVQSKPTLTVINYYGEKIVPEDPMMRYMADGGGVGSTRPDMLASPEKKRNSLSANDCGDQFEGKVPLASHDECLCVGRDSPSFPRLSKVEDDVKESSMTRNKDADTESGACSSLDVFGASHGDNRYSESHQSDCEVDQIICDKLRKIAWTETEEEEINSVVYDVNRESCIRPPGEIRVNATASSQSVTIGGAAATAAIATTSASAAIATTSATAAIATTSATESDVEFFANSLSFEDRDSLEFISEDTSDFVEPEGDALLDQEEELLLSEPWDWISI